jgi:hypothetical protein
MTLNAIGLPSNAAVHPLPRLVNNYHSKNLTDQLSHLVLGASLCSAAIALQLFCPVDLTAGILDFSRTTTACPP